MKTFTLFTFLTLLSFHSFSADFQVSKIASGFKIPWGLQFIDKQTLIITEKNGAIYQLSLTDGQRHKLFDVPLVDDGGQGGLLDVALSPKDKHQLYFTYSQATKAGAATTLAYARYENGAISQWTDLLVTSAESDTGRHFGSRIAFDGNGHLFMTLGDRGERDNGQDLSNHAATILRLNLDGSVPQDNPFVSRKGYADEVWSYGHRNPQGIVFDQLTNQLWAIEHGPRGGDEINLVTKGKNYGWPVTSHGKEYWGPISVGEAKELPGIKSPSLVYVPSIAPSSLVLYRGDNYPELNGKLLAGALKLTHINVVAISSSGNLAEEQRLFENLNERIRDITISPDDQIYFSTDNGNIYRIIPSK